MSIESIKLPIGPGLEKIKEEVEVLFSHLTTFEKIKIDLSRKESVPSDFKTTVDELVDDLKNNSIHYTQDFIEHLNTLLSDADDRESAEDRAEKDRARTIAHNALLAQAQIVARALKKIDLNYEFMNDRFLQNRSQVGSWAIANTLFLVQQDFEINNTVN